MKAGELTRKMVVNKRRCVKYTENMTVRLLLEVYWGMERKIM